MTISYVHDWLYVQNITDKHGEDFLNFDKMLPIYHQIEVTTKSR